MSRSICSSRPPCGLLIFAAGGNPRSGRADREREGERERRGEERRRKKEGGENERWGGGRGAKGLESCKGRWLYNCEFGGYLSGGKRSQRTDGRPGGVLAVVLVVFAVS
jgi:hypothetical protein